jgi:hypothetical protein
MDLNEHLKTSWNLTLQSVVPLIFLTLILICVSVLTLGILAPAAAAGYMHSLQRLLREGREPRLQDIFSQMRLFFPLLAFAAASALLSLVGYVLLVLPGVLVSLAILYACLYVIPLMTDRGLGLFDAVRKSWEMAMEGNRLDHLLVVIIVAGLTAVGGSVVFASLFTQPLATLFLLSVYDEKISNG